MHGRGTYSVCLSTLDLLLYRTFGEVTNASAGETPRRVRGKRQGECEEVANASAGETPMRVRGKRQGECGEVTNASAGKSPIRLQARRKSAFDEGE